MNTIDFNFGSFLGFFQPIKSLVSALFNGTKINGVPLILILLCLFVFGNLLSIITHIKSGASISSVSREFSRNKVQKSYTTRSTYHE